MPATDSVTLYRVVDTITADSPTYYVDCRDAWIRRDGSIKLAKPFYGLANVIFPKDALDRLFFHSPRAALLYFAEAQRHKARVAVRAKVAADTAVLWATSALQLEGE